MMTRFQWLIAPGLALALTVGAAGASVVQVTFSGTIYAGHDTYNRFGTGSTDLGGQNITATFTYDTSVGSYSSNSTTVEAYGGSYYSLSAQSPVSASVEVNGTTLGVSGDYQSDTVAYDDGSTYSLRYYSAVDETTFAGGASAGTQLSSNCSGASGELPLDPASSFTVPSSGCGGIFQITDFDGSSYSISTLANATFYKVSVQAIDVAPVPLPAGGALLFGALGALGLVRRRKARRAA